MRRIEPCAPRCVVVGLRVEAGIALVSLLTGCTAQHPLQFVYGDQPSRSNGIMSFKPGVVRFQVRDDDIVAYGVVARDTNRSRPEKSPAVEVRSGEAFVSFGFNCEDRWRLVQLADRHAQFEVTTRVWGCTDLMAICLGIPSAKWKQTVIVCGRQRDRSTTNADTAGGGVND